MKIGLLEAALIFVPITLALGWLHAPNMLIFISSILALIPLAGKMGEATEELAKYMGSNAGGLLNATFGNATELIIALLAINQGLFELVKASITGSIIGNMLFVLGLSFLVGGARYKTQSFNAKAAGVNSTMLLIAVASMLIPSAFYFFSQNGSHELVLWQTEEISLLVSILLIVIYLLSLLFSFRTHSYLFRKHSFEKAKWSKNFALLVLVVSTVLVGVMAEIFVGSIEPVAQQLGFSELFIGAIIVAIVGNAAEHITAIMASLKNDIDLVLSVTVGSSIQIALFVAPILVITSFLMGKPINLAFTLFEILAVFASVLIVNEIASDSECNWFEGAQLVTMYLIIAVLFFFA